MSTRLYGGADTPNISPSRGSQWDTTPSPGGLSTLDTSPDPGSNIASASKSETRSFVNNVNLRRLVSSKALAAQTISGNFSAVFSVGQSAADADLSLQLVIRVVSSDGLTERGVLYAGHSAALNTTAGALGQEESNFGSPTFSEDETRIFNNVALTPLDVELGDRLVVEIGYRAHNVTATSKSGVIYYSSGAALDDHTLVAGELFALDLNPWIEFDSDIQLVVLVPSIGSAEAFGTAVLLANLPSIEPAGIASAEAVGAPTITTVVYIDAAGIASAEAVGEPALRQYVTLFPSGITMPTDAVGTPTVLADQAIAPTGIASSEVFGSPAVTQEIFLASTPYVEEAPAALQPPHNRVSLRKGVTVYLIDGVYHTTRYPQEGSLDNADAVYHGGREYEVTAALATELEAEGFTIRTEIR